MGSGFSESQQEVSERPELKMQITPILGTAWMPGGWGGNEVIKGERDRVCEDKK